ncbi:DNA-binding transcriptional regulator LsrR (DeoR family) [Lachnotalea glycerini]|uniref:DNA-binding transcriptional regulator LsrR (DeoR family) n=1 Tax=Lachnotalea glycerini TaxID=1763509 RepID=A0A255IIV7_9FIRM|nr:sugar-binding domain-containing protein [Lachnotalea glycerini]PXV93338.1 DNA-binding transcriptional regulator LsrR (DeoR family) [Lachnotalea glycerini]RDY31989.1 hypothetical protein CG710_006715 [Lachnotalea glycerini]
MDSNELRLLVKICKMYYLEDLSQNEIAKQLFISRPQVSKLISKAKQKNIISFQINDPFSEEDKAAEQLKKRYHIEDVLVVDTRDVNSECASEKLAKNMSFLITRYVSNGSVIGISAGYTVAACSKYCNIYNCKNLQFIPLVAGQSFEGENWYANQSCQRFASRLKSKYMLLNTPLIIRNTQAREELENNIAVRPVLDCYDHLDTILLGIGQATPESTLGKCSISKDEINWAYEHGVKAVIGASFIDAGGNEISGTQSDFFIGIKVAQIRKCKSVVAVATGIHKVEAIKATLKGEYVNAFCTDLVTAQELLK